MTVTGFNGSSASLSRQPCSATPAPLRRTVAVFWRGTIAGRVRRTSYHGEETVAVRGELLFRLVYYGDWLPNTAYIKVGLTPARFMQGLAYVGGGARRPAPLLLPAAAGLLAGIGDARDRRPHLFSCEECITGIGHVYNYIIPKHKSDRNIFIEMLRVNGMIQVFGPALRV